MAEAAYQLPPSPAAAPLWERVRAHFIEMIQRGELEPGQALPPHMELCERVGVGNETLQRALKELARQGWVTRYRRRGTFVSDPLPAARARTIAVMTRPVFDPRVGSFDLLQARALAGRLSAAGEDFRFYSNHFPADEAVFEPEADEVDPGLARDVEAGRVDGLLVLGAIPPRADGFRELVKARRLPVVQTSRYAREGARVCFDPRRFFEEAGQLLAGRGVRRPALLRFGGQTGRDPVGASRDEARRDGRFDYETTDITVPPLTGEAEAHDAVLDAFAGDAPFDALVCADDVLAKGAATALLSLGRRVPDDVFVITQANRGSGIRYPLPFVEIAFDVDALMETAWRTLEQAIDRGEPPRGVTFLPPTELPDEPG